MLGGGDYLFIHFNLCLGLDVQPTFLPTSLQLPPVLHTLTGKGCPCHLGIPATSPAHSCLCTII